MFAPVEPHEESPEADATTRASPEDLALVARLLDGDEAAFSALIEQLYGSLLRLAMLFVSNPATAEEVVQETWAAVLSGLRSFEGRSSLKTWIFRILSNRAKTRAVREGRSIPFSALGEPDDEPAVDPARFNTAGKWAQPPVRWSEETPEQLILRRELVICLHKAVDALTAQQRAVFTLRDMEDLDAKQVCSILEISETNQRVLLHRARARVRRALAKSLGEE